MRAVVVLPFVPAIWTTGMARCGEPSRSTRAVMRVREGSSRLSGHRASNSRSTRAMSPVLPLLILPRMPVDAVPRMRGMTTDISPQDTTVPAAGAVVVPEKPTLEGIEPKWIARWAAEDTYAFDRAAALRAPREQTWSID